MSPNPAVPNEYSVYPIGFIRSVLKLRAEAPKFGNEGAPHAWLDLHPSVADGLQGIVVGDEIILLTWFHESRRDVLKLHPRCDKDLPLTGVFATRSPDRPDPIGLHRVTVLEITGTSLDLRLDAWKQLMERRSPTSNQWLHNQQTHERNPSARSFISHLRKTHRYGSLVLVCSWRRRSLRCASDFHPDRLRPHRGRHRRLRRRGDCGAQHPFYLGFLYFSGRWSQKFSSEGFWFSALTGLCVGAGTIAFFILFQRGGPLSSVPVILAGGAAIMAIAGIFFFNEPASISRIVGIMLALAGLFLLRS